MTNQVKYLREMDRIIVMDECAIAEQGTYDELIALNQRFAEFIQTHQGTDVSDSSSSSSSSSDEGDRVVNDIEKAPALKRQKSPEASVLRKRKRAALERCLSVEAEKRSEKQAELQEEEEHCQGAVSWQSSLAPVSRFWTEHTVGVIHKKVLV